MTALLNQARDLLTQREPARAIGYGAIAFVWLVTHGAFALGLIHTPPPAFDVILAAVTGAIALLTEGFRMFAFSPATVALIQVEAAAAAAGAAATPSVAPNLSASDWEAIRAGVDPRIVVSLPPVAAPIPADGPDLVDAGTGDA